MVRPRKWLEFECDVIFSLCFIFNFVASYTLDFEGLYNDRSSVIAHGLDLFVLCHDFIQKVCKFLDWCSDFI